MTTEARKRATKNWKARNPEKVKASASRCHKRYYLKNKEVIKKRVAEYARTEKGKKVLSASGKRWRYENKEKAQLNSHNYYAQRRSRSDGSVTTEAIKELFSKQAGVCAITGISIASGYHIDHIIPISKGGQHTISNIQLVLPTVNLQKKDRLNFTRELIKI